MYPLELGHKIKFRVRGASEATLFSACTPFPGGSEVKNLPANAGDPGSVPGLGRSPGEGNGNPLQYSCLENPMDRGAWWSMGFQKVGHKLVTKQQQQAPSPYPPNGCSIPVEISLLIRKELTDFLIGITSFYKWYLLYWSFHLLVPDSASEASGRCPASQIQCSYASSSLLGNTLSRPQSGCSTSSLKSLVEARSKKYQGRGVVLR